MSTLDPRTKLVLLLLFILLAMLTPNAAALLIECALIVLVILVYGWIKAWRRVMRAVALLVLFLFAFYLWAFDWQIALVGALRLCASISAFFLFFQLTTPEDLGNALAQSGVPYPFVFILITSMQFAPVLSRQARAIFDAQRARGIRLELDVASLGNFTALLAPLLIQAFTLAEQLAEAMEARGFGAPQRTFVREYRLRAWDYCALLCGAGSELAVILLVR